MSLTGNDRLLGRCLENKAATAGARGRIRVPQQVKPQGNGGNLIGKAAFAQIEFATDSPLEGTGFEPSVPRERLVPSCSFTPTFPLARVNRPDPIPKAYITRGPMVRIRSPPAASLMRT